MMTTAVLDALSNTGPNYIVPVLFISVIIFTVLGITITKFGLMRVLGFFFGFSVPIACLLLGMYVTQENSNDFEHECDDIHGPDNWKLDNGSTCGIGVCYNCVAKTVIV